ncbi:hypothetical protein EMIT0P260_80103 [Pseudomonas sp. IT-P260]
MILLSRTKSKDRSLRQLLQVAKQCLTWEPFKARRRPSPVTTFRQGLKNQQVSLTRLRSWLAFRSLCRS